MILKKDLSFGHLNILSHQNMENRESEYSLKYSELIKNKLKNKKNAPIIQNVLNINKNMNIINHHL